MKMYKTKKTIKILGSLLAFSSLFAASFWAKLYLSPATGTFVYNCPFNVDVMIDMEGQDTTDVDLKMLVDDVKFTIMDFDGQGGLFKTYTKPKYIKVKWGQYAWINNVYVFLSTFAPPTWVRGIGRVGTLKIKPSLGIWELPLNFFFQAGNERDDSNVAVSSWGKIYDALASVENGYYTFKDWPCPEQSDAYLVQPESTGFELVKNQVIVKGNMPSSSLLMAFFQKYGRYVLLLFVLIALWFVWKNTHKTLPKKK